MDKKIYDFINKLKEGLEGLPDKEIQEALGYYKEYLNDALDSGKNIDEVIEKLGTVDSIADNIKTEASIIKAQQNPGLKNYTSVLINVFSQITAPFSILFLTVFIIISYSMVIILFAGAFAALIASVGSGLCLIYYAFKIPPQYAIEVAGTFGFAFFSAGILLLLSLGQYELGRLFIKISTRLIRIMIKKQNEPISSITEQKVKSKLRKKLITTICIILSVVGLGLFLISGIPVKYFTIFNSMKPDDINVITQEVNPDFVDNIILNTANSHIILKKGDTADIIVEYEQPDWLDYDMVMNENTLSFIEKSNGRLPLYELVSIHESRTELTVYIPEDFSPSAVTIKSKGGYVYIEGINEEINVKTYTGSIFVQSAEGVNLDAVTIKGSINANDSLQIQETSQGMELSIEKGAEKTITLESKRGNISID